MTRPDASTAADEAVARLRRELGDGDGGHDLDTLEAELVELRAIADQARTYLSTTDGHAVAFAEGLARATLVVMLDEAGR